MRLLDDLQIADLLGVIPLRSPFGARDHAMIRLALYTGLRVSELVGLDIGLVVDAHGNPRFYLDLPAGLTKCRRSRRVPLSEQARQAIADLSAFLLARGFCVEPDSPLLQNRHHQRLPVRTVQGILQKYREMADLSVRATPHTLRHTFASESARRASIRAVQLLLGHRSLESTQIYLHTQPDELWKAVQRSPL